MILRIYLAFALIMLLSALGFGVLANAAFLQPELANKYLPFYQLRPFHVSAVLFWILSAATGGIMVYRKQIMPVNKKADLLNNIFIVGWIATSLAIFICYGLKKFGGREYWEFPPILCMPLLVLWTVLLLSFIIPWWQMGKQRPIYVWMWGTGLLFFLLTFIEQNLWQIDWFRQSLLREVTVQWKSNGAMVGAWNQMIYGTSLFLMIKISGDESLARGRQVYFFYFLGLSNLMFNWGHHIYNVPTASWIRNMAYIISMTELLFLWAMIRAMKQKIEERSRLKHIVSYRFLINAEFWIFMNLLLALTMSIPAVNRYTHGTHITVAHAMGATIGISTMILLASFSYLLNVDGQSEKLKNNILRWNIVCQISLLIFWLSLIWAGIIKGYRMNVLHITSFQEMMSPVLAALQVLLVSGIGIAISLGAIAIQYLRLVCSKKLIHNINPKIVQN